MVYVIQVCCVYSEKLLMMDRGTVQNMYRVYSKNKFEKLVRIFGLIIWIQTLLSLECIHNNRNTLLNAPNNRSRPETKSLFVSSNFKQCQQLTVRRATSKIERRKPYFLPILQRPPFLLAVHRTLFHSFNVRVPKGPLMCVLVSYVGV